MNEWLAFTLILLGIWSVIYFARPLARKKMLWASILTAPFGLTEPLFIPAYWSPPSLFDLASKTGFDIESLVFSFAIGGIGSVLYEAIFGGMHAMMGRHEMHRGRHRFHKLALASPVIIFIPLAIFTSLNPIYTASIAMLSGGIAAAWCRPDLKMRMLVGGLLFLALYFVFFLSFNFVYPYAVQSFWNLPALTGILVLGVPLEELLFAFTFGLMWSGIYEHFTWTKSVAKARR